MNIILLEVGLFNIILVFIMYKQIKEDNHNCEDYQLFSKLLIACMAILFIDTFGWLIDGNPIYNQLWITNIVDGLDLILTTYVCYCWVNYALYIAKRNKPKHQYLPKTLLIIQIILVSLNYFFKFYYYIDNLGVYHRGNIYIIHTVLSLILLSYSSLSCLYTYSKTNSKELKKELLYIAFVILIPIIGNIFQYYVYGYPTVWLCMILMILSTYIHIQNKRVNKEKEVQNKELQLALKKMQIASKAKTDFMNHMSHDLRTPLNGIIGLSYLMDEETNITELKKQIPQLRLSAKYLLQLINDILDVNKIESGILKLNPTICNEQDIFNSIINIVKPEIINKNINFNFKTINIDWKYMLLDEQRVKQIFINLLNNAIKFTPKGGNIDFIMELVSLKDNIIIDKFVIKDTGIGISPKFINHIFEPFEQENRIFVDSTGGTGLGLPIVKELVELMNGEIQIESTENIGTTVTLYLSFPLAKKPEIKDNKQATSYQLEGLHILLCEDHPLNAKIAIKLLEKQGITVTLASDGQIGLDLFKQSAINEYQMILMDIRMPKLDGLQTTKAIRQLQREDAKTIPIIAMTANAYDEDIKKSLQAGMNEHLSKPIQPKLLFTTLEKYNKRLK